MSIIIRLQNLSWSANSLDIRQFFQGLFIPEGGVHIVGGENGDVFIAFGSDEDARQAMQKDGGKLKDMKIKLLLSSRAEMQRVIEQARTPAIIPPTVTIPSPPPPPSSSSQQTTSKEISSSKDERSKRSPEKRRSDRSSREKSKERERSSKRSSRRSRSRSPRRSRDKDRESDRRSKRDDRYKSSDDRHKSQERSRGKDEISETSRQTNTRQPNNPTPVQSAPSFVNPNSVPSAKMEVNNQDFRPPFDQNQRQGNTWNVNNNTNNDMNFGMGMNGRPTNNMLQGNRPPFPRGNEMYNPNQNSRFDQNNYFPRPSFGSSPGGSINQMPGNMPISEYGMSSNVGDPRMMPNIQGMGDNRNEQNFRSNMDPRNHPDNGNRPMEMNRAMNNNGMSGGMMTPTMMQEKQSVYNSGMPGGMVTPSMMQEKQSMFNSGMPVGIVAPSMMQEKQSMFNSGMPGGIVTPGMVQEKQPTYNSSMPNNNFSGPMPGPTGNAPIQGFAMTNNELIPEKMPPNNMRGISDTVGRDPRSMSNPRGNVDPRSMSNPRGNEDRREKSAIRGQQDGKSRDSPDTKGSPHIPEVKKTNNNEPGKPNKKNTNPDQQTCIEMKGLPLFIGYSHIRDFFRGISIPTDGIKIINNDQGQRTGIAYVRFNSEKDRLDGLKRTGNQVDTKSVTLGRVSYQTFSDAIDSFLPPGMKPPKSVSSSAPEQAEICVMMKGLPFSSKNTDILAFFNGIEIKNVFIEQDMRLKRGTGFVQFSTPDDLKAAMSNNGKPMGDGYIELSTITKEEMQSHVAPKKNAPLPTLNPEQVPTNCLAVRGLPATVIDRQLADFFGEAGFIPHAIHMMLSANGKPTGDAYIEFNNPHECEVGLKRNGHLIGSKPIQIFPISHQEMIAILNGGIQQGMQPGNMRDNGTYENKSLMGTPLLNTPMGPQNFIERPCNPDGFMGTVDNCGEPNNFHNHPDKFCGYSNGPQSQFDLNQRSDNRQGLLDTPRGHQEGPRGEPMEFRRHPIDSRGLLGDPIGPSINLVEQLGKPRGSFDNFTAPSGDSNGHPEERGYTEGPWGYPSDGPRRYSDRPSGHPDDPRGRPDDPREQPGDPRRHSDGHRRHLDDPRVHPDGHRRHPDEPWGHPNGPKRHSDGLLGPMNSPRVGLLDSARGRPLLGDGMENGRPPLLDSNDRLIMDSRGPEAFRGPDGKRKGRPLLEFEDAGHFNPDENRRHDNHPHNRGYGDFNSGMPEGHPAHMGHRHGPKVYHERASGHSRDKHEITSSIDGFGHPGCVVGASNVPYRATMNDIMAFFEGFGLVQDNIIRRYDASGRVTGDVRIAFHTPDDAHRAVTELDGTTIRGRNVSLFMP